MHNPFAHRCQISAVAGVIDEPELAAGEGSVNIQTSRSLEGRSFWANYHPRDRGFEPGQARRCCQELKIDREKAPGCAAALRCMRAADHLPAARGFAAAAFPDIPLQSALLLLDFELEHIPPHLRSLPLREQNYSWLPLVTHEPAHDTRGDEMVEQPRVIETTSWNEAALLRPKEYGQTRALNHK